jgi:hypothetical protein
MYSLALIIFVLVVSEKKAFEHFPIGSNVNLCPAGLVSTLLDTHAPLIIGQTFDWWNGAGYYI